MGLIQKFLEKLIHLRTKLIREPKWATVYQSHEEYSVHIRKLKLDEEGISSVIFDQRDSSYNAFGYVFLNVPVNELERAEQILKETHE